MTPEMWLSNEIDLLREETIDAKSYANELAIDYLAEYPEVSTPQEDVVKFIINEIQTGV